MFFDQAGRRSVALLPVESVSTRYCSLSLAYFAEDTENENVENICPKLEVGLRDRLSCDTTFKFLVCRLTNCPDPRVQDGSLHPSHF